MPEVFPPTGEPSGPLADLILAFIKAEEAGQSPDREAIIQANPQYARELREFFAEHDQAKKVISPEESVTGEYEPHGTNETPEADRQQMIKLSAHSPNSSKPRTEEGTIIAGKYKLLKKIKDGGMGSVWMAEQRMPVKRLVAVKMILPHYATKEGLARFDSERQALALMDHPNIAKVFDGGLTDSGEPFFVMELVKGGKPITQYCDENRLTPRQRLELFVPVCQAIQHAHQKGLIHRDIKPGNVLVGMYDDRPVAKVIDFGVAKAVGISLTDQSLITLAGWVGTFKYMSPEQAIENNLDIDTRSDVYALGVLMYELLTGSLPFPDEELKKAGAMEILRMIREVDPPRPSTKLSSTTTAPNVSAYRNTEPKQLSQLMRGELDWIVMKALEKQRTRRYETANAFAIDVQRYLAGERVEAVPPSVVYRMRKFVRKNRGPVIAGLLVFVTLIAGVIGTSIGIMKTNKARQDEQERADGEKKAKEAAIRSENLAEARRMQAEKALADTTYQLGISNFLLAVAAYENRNPGQALEHLNRVPAGQRRWEWDYLRQQAKGGIFNLSGQTEAVRCVAFSPDGLRMVTGGSEKIARVWDARRGNVLVQLIGDTDYINCASFSPNGSLIATVGQQIVRVWDAQTGRPLVRFEGQSVEIVSIAFSPDGSRLVTGSVDNAARVWDTLTGKRLLELNRHEGVVVGAAFSPDGASIVTASADCRARVWDARTGKLRLELIGHTVNLTSVAYSPNGNRIVTTSMDETTRVWDARTGTPELLLRGHAADVACVAYSPDGSRLVTGGMDNTARVWDVTSGAQLLELKCLSGVLGVAFSPDGMRVATCGSEQTACVWDAQSGSPVVELKGHWANVSCVVFSPDGSRLVTASADDTARVWDTVSGTPLVELIGHGTSVACASFSPDSRRVATGGYDNIARVWDSRTGSQLLELKGHSNGVVGLAFSPDGSQIVTTSRDGTARLWDAQTGKLIVTLKGHDTEVYCAVYSPDGSVFVTGGLDDSARIWHARTGAPLGELNSARFCSVDCLAFSPDGAHLLTGGRDGTARVWDFRTKKPIAELKGHNPSVTSVAYSPDGARVITGSPDKTVRMWDTKNWTLLISLKSHRTYIESVAFSPCGTRIATAGRDKTVLVWDTRGRVQEGSGDEKWDAPELAHRLFHTRPRPDRHLEAFTAAEQAKDLFTMRFHLDRLLSMPKERHPPWLSRRNELTNDPRHPARVVYHNLEFADNEYDLPAVILMASAGDRLSQRLVAQERIRQGKPALAIPLLHVCMITRPVNSPPVEELLIAKAYLDMNDQAKAKLYFQAATNWLDRPRTPIRAAEVITKSAINGWAALGEAFKPIDDPRHNPFDWESWHECDVFREQIERVLKPMKQ